MLETTHIDERRRKGKTEDRFVLKNVVYIYCVSTIKTRLKCVGMIKYLMQTYKGLEHRIAIFFILNIQN